MKKYHTYLKENNQQTLLQIINDVINKKIDPYILKEYLGKELSKYEIDNIDEYEISILCEESDIERLLNVEDGIISYILSIRYNDYYVDENDVEHIFQDMDNKTKSLIKEFADELDYKIILNEIEVYDFLNYLELDEIFNDYIFTLSNEYKSALVSLINKEILNVVPFEINYFKKTQLEINLEKLKKYIKESNKDFKNITEIFKHIGEHIPYTYEITEYMYKYINDNNIKKDIYNSVIIYYNHQLTDEFWLNIIKHDNINLFKKYYKKINWNKKITSFELSSQKYFIDKLPDNILNKTSKIYKFIKTPEVFLEIKKQRTKNKFNL